MARNTSSLPQMRHHRSSNQAYVFLNGRDVYLGVLGSPGVRKEYDRVIAEWLANDRRSIGGTDLTVAELAVRYQEFADRQVLREDVDRRNPRHQDGVEGPD